MAQVKKWCPIIKYRGASVKMLEKSSFKHTNTKNTYLHYLSAKLQSTCKIFIKIAKSNCNIVPSLFSSKRKGVCKCTTDPKTLRITQGCFSLY